MQPYVTFTWIHFMEKPEYTCFGIIAIQRTKHCILLSKLVLTKGQRRINNFVKTLVHNVTGSSQPGRGIWLLRPL